MDGPRILPSLAHPNREHLLPAITVPTAAEDAAQRAALRTLQEHGARLQEMPTYDPARSTAFDFATDTVTYWGGIYSRESTVVIPALDMCTVADLEGILFPLVGQDPRSGTLFVDIGDPYHYTPLLDRNQLLRDVRPGYYIRIEDIPALEPAGPMNHELNLEIQLNP